MRKITLGRHHESKPKMSEAAQNWARQNAEARAHPFCQCGAPATWERRISATDGYSVHMTCDAHRLVNGWSQQGDGPWIAQAPMPLSWWTNNGTVFSPIHQETP